MAIDLMSLEPQKISKNLKGKFIWVYSLPGMGKTTLGSQFPKSLICGFEQGTNGLNNIYVQPEKTWNDWKLTVSQLCKKPQLKEKFETIVIDTVDEAWELCVKKVCADNNIDTLSDLSWGLGHSLAKKEFSQPLRDLAYSGYGIVFISHAMTKEVGEGEDKHEYVVPTPPKTAFNIVNKMVDIIAYITELENSNKERKRFVFFRETDKCRDFLVKSRFKYIRPYAEFSYSNIVEAIYDAIEQEVEHSGGTVTEEQNPYYQLNYEELMEEAKNLWIKIVEENLKEKAMEILKENFGREIKFSEVKPEEVEQLNHTLMDLRELF